MEKRTINGIPVQEVFQNLKKDIPGVVKMTKENDSKPYLDAAIMRKAFDMLIPPENYDFSLTQVELVKLGNRACFTCTGTITVYDDFGNKIISKSYTGSNNCIISKNGGEAIDLAMDAKNAAVSARKGCIQLFGCGERQLEEAKAAKNAKDNKGGNQKPYGQSAQNLRALSSANAGPSRNQGTKTTNASAGTINCPPTGKGHFLLAMDTSKQVVDTPTMMLIPVFCREYRNYPTKLLIWKNRCKNLNDIMNGILTGIEFYCDGKFEPYNREYRIVMENVDGNR